MIRLGITLGIVGIAIVAALAWSSVAGDMALALMGHYLVFCGTVLVFYQIRLGVIVERRRATAEFLFGPLFAAAAEEAKVAPICGVEDRDAPGC